MTFTLGPTLILRWFWPWYWPWMTFRRSHNENAKKTEIWHWPLTLAYRLDFQSQASYCHEPHKISSLKSVGSKDKVDTNGRTDRRTLPIVLPSRLTRSVNIFSDKYSFPCLAHFSHMTDNRKFIHWNKGWNVTLGGTLINKTNYLMTQTLSYSCWSKHSYGTSHRSLSPREREGICFYRRWFVCLSVCDHDN